MGRKRKKANTNKKVNNKRKSSVNIDLAVILLFIVSILLFVLIYGEKGAIGEILSPALGGIIGFIKYIIPIGFMILAICVAKDDRSYITSKLIQYIVLLSCIAATMSIYEISKGTINADLEFKDIIEASYDLGVKNIGGGTVGAVIAYPLIKLLGMFGAAVATAGVVVVLCVFTFGLHPSEIMLDIMDEMYARREEREEALLSRREQRMARRENMRNSSNSLEIENNNSRNNKKINDIQTSIDEDEITINLNNESPSEIKEQKSKFGLFGRKRTKDNEEQKSNPDVIEANIYKNTAKQAEAEHSKNLNEDNLFTVEEEQKESKTKAVLQLEHTISIEDENYEYPPVSILAKNSKKTSKTGAKALTEKATQLQRTLHSFGVSAKVENISVGPAITRYELKPAEGVRVSKIANLADDIALNLAAESIRIEAPIPGKQAVGIEIPNKEKESVPLRDVIESDEFGNNKSKLTVALGKDVAGNIVLADIAKMPHVLIAGSTGSGKSVCINTVITSFIYNAKPSEVKLVMVDPKVVELSVYNGIPHLLIPVVTDPRKAAGALAWAVQEMDNRYNLFAEKGVRDLKGYNAAIEHETDGTAGKLPQIVIIIDELADLMMVAAKEVEESICRLAQKARAAGMHLVIATQRPSVDVITGLIKANIPSRIAFAVSSQIDSRTILDQVGAEKLLGKGDMLFYPASASKPLRVQGAFVSDNEVEKIVDFVKSNGVASYNEDILEEIEKSNKSDGQIEKEAEEDDTDPLLMDAIDVVVEVGQASTSFIQRKFKVGYARAGRIIDQMEARGIISGYEGSKPRKVLITMDRLNELKMATPPQDNEASEEN